MALGSTLFKARISIADIDRGYYADHTLALARHPSETDERMMVRLLAFVLNAGERLEFGRGLSTPDEPALQRTSLDGSIELWIEVGLPDERVLRRALGHSTRVEVFTYGGRTVDAWWMKQGGAISRLPRLRVLRLPAEATTALAALARPGMEVQFTIQDNVVLASAADGMVEIAPITLYAAE